MNYVRRLFAGTATACAVAIPASALTAEPPIQPAAEATLDEVIVTAGKRAVDVQDLPAAVSVLNEETLARGGISDAVQLTKLIPGLVIGKQSAVGVVFLRGVGQNVSTPNSQPGVSMNINGAYMPRELTGSSFFDLERIEVLPGPQGTLYGTNAAGGAVNLITRRPRSEYGSDAFVEAGNYSAVHAFAGVDAPLGDRTAVRLALDYNEHDGYLSNGANDADSLGARLSLSVNPSDQLSILAQYQYTRDRGIGPQNLMRGTANPPFGSASDPYVDTFPTNGLFQKNDGHILTGEVHYTFDNGISLSWIPSYMRSQNDSAVQYNGFLKGRFKFEVEQYSSELRLTSPSSERLKWLVGLYWFRSMPLAEVQVGLPTTPPFNFVNIYNTWQSYAAFGEATYSVTDSLRLTVGGRVSLDGYDGYGNQIAFVPAPSTILFGAKEDNGGRGDWKLGVEYDLTADSMLYASVQSGYMQGGYTQADLNSPSAHTFKPAKLLAFTGGSKNRFLDGRLQINNEIFYYDYRDYQLQTVVFDQSVGSTIFLIVNVPKAEIYGDQLDLSYRPAENTNIALSVIYQSAKVVRGLNTVPSSEGYRLPSAPKFVANLTLEQRFPLSNGSYLAARLASTYNSGYWTEFTHDDFSFQESFTKTDINVSYNAPGDRWSIGAYVRNIEDEATYYSSVAGPDAALPTFIDAPRTYGVRVEAKF
jgi:iron complex outermembrane receptor protein